MVYSNPATKAVSKNRLRLIAMSNPMSKARWEGLSRAPFQTKIPSPTAMRQRRPSV